MPKTLSDQRREALARRDNGKGNRAHTLSQLTAQDMDRLLRVLTTGLRDSCGHCRQRRSAHGDRCTEHHVRELSEHLRSHAGALSRGFLRQQGHARRAGVGELCNTHLQLRPELMWDILGVFTEAEDGVARVAAAALGERGAVDSLVEGARRDVYALAPLKAVAEASLMWMAPGAPRAAARRWKARYPGARRRTQWVPQPDGCAACMLARTLGSAELLGVVLMSLCDSRCSGDGGGDARSSHASRVAWVRRCLDCVSEPQRSRALTAVERVRAWLEEWLPEADGQHGTGGQLSGVDRRPYADLVVLFQQEEMARLHAHPENQASTIGVHVEPLAGIDARPGQPFTATPPAPVEMGTSPAGRPPARPAPLVELQSTAYPTRLQPEVIYSPSVYSPQGSHHRGFPRLQSVDTARSRLALASSTRPMNSNETDNLAGPAFPATPQKLARSSQPPRVQSHMTGYEAFWPASMDGSNDWDCRSADECSTVFMDDDALNGEFTFKKRHVARALGLRSAVPPGADVTMPSSRPVPGSFPRPELPRSARNEAQPQWSNVKSRFPAYACDSTSDDASPARLAGPPRSSGVSDMGHRIDSLAYKLTTEFNAIPSNHAIVQDGSFLW